MSFAVTITPNSINMLLDGRMRTLEKSHTNYEAVKAAIKAYQSEPLSAILDEIKVLIDIPTFIARVTEGKVQVSDNEVLYDGVKTHSVIATRLLEMLKHGFDPRPLARFMDKMMQMPREDTRNDLYEWLEKGGLPICDDGDFLAFKKVNDAYKSYWDTTVDHSIGTRPWLPREECDDNRNNTCSSGLHFCSFNYLSSYDGSSGHVVVKINPVDVVAIPYDYGITKGRACTYEVISEVPQEECAHVFEGQPVITEFGTWAGEEEDNGNPATDWKWTGPGHGDAVITGTDNGLVEPFSIPAADGEKVEKPKAFVHPKTGKKVAAAKIEKTVSAHGQRGASRILGIPRTTIQDWLRRLGLRN